MKIDKSIKAVRRLIESGHLTEEGDFTSKKFGQYETMLLRTYVHAIVPLMSEDERARVYTLGSDIKLHFFINEWLPTSREETKVDSVFNGKRRVIAQMTLAEYRESNIRNEYLDAIVG